MILVNCHTWRAKRTCVRKKQRGFFNKTKLRTWDEFESEEGEEEWAGWIPRTEDDRLKLQESVLCPEWMNDDG